MPKKLLCVFLSLLFILTVIPFSASAAETTTQKISAINKTRLTDYLVIYTRSYGSTTATNVYGTEATVTNGTVTSVGGNSSAIPAGENSFVISGHGTMSDWVKNTVIVGMKASYDASTMTLTLVFDDSTLLFRVNDAKKRAEDAKAQAEEAFLVYDSNADALFDSAIAKLNSLTDPTEAEIDKLVADFDKAAMLYSEREVAEYRGVWLRPTQKNMTEVRNYVKQCVKAGINMISIETMYSGTMIYKTPADSLFKQNPIFKGFDVLAAFSEVCAEYGVELHCWMPVFYSCNSSGENWHLSVAAKKPEWQLKTNNGSSIYSYETTGMVFLNPALDEVQDFLAETYTYILENYDIHGFQLDYIRYRDRYADDDFGYDSTTIAKFKEAYPKYKNSTISFDTRAEYWNDWAKFRALQVTKFVKRMRDIIDTVAPDVLLTADVGPQFESSYATIYQDSKSWLESGLLDMIHPMAYGSGYAPQMQRFLEAAGEDCMVVPGLGIFMEEFDGDDMAAQAYEMAQIGCDGVVYFQTAQYFSKDADGVLSSTLYTEPSLAPAFDDIKTVQSIMFRSAERIRSARDAGKLSESLAFELLVLCESVVESADSKAARAIEEINALRDKLNALPSSALRERLLRDAQIAYFSVLRDVSSHPTGLGDVNNDGTINQYDYLLVKRHHFETRVLTSDEALRADVNKDGNVNQYDYLLIARHYFGTYVIK